MDETDETRFQRGLKALQEIHPGVGDAVVARLNEIAPDFARMLVAHPFGDIYARPGLDRRSRQIATIAALTTLGSAERELGWHIRGGLNVGLTRDEVLEVIVQMSVYAGFPRAIAALDVAKRAFEEYDKGGGPKSDDAEHGAEAARQADA